MPTAILAPPARPDDPRRRILHRASAFLAGFLLPTLAAAQSPWLQAVDVLEEAFTGPIAKGLSVVAVVIAGLLFAFGEGASKKALAGVIFGAGMALAAVNFLDWLFP